MIVDAELQERLADFHAHSRWIMRRREAGTEVTNSLRRWIKAWESDAEGAAEAELRAAQRNYRRISAEPPPRRAG